MQRFLQILLQLSCVMGSISMVGCDKDMSVALNSDNVDALTLNSVDSISVEVSTVLMPYIPTSGPSVIFLGQYNRAGIGMLKSTPYFRIEPVDFDYSTIPTEAQFDSITLELNTHVNKYYLGDTTSIQKISVHKLTDPLETTTIQAGGINNIQRPVYVQQAAIFGDQKFEYDAAPLGELTYLPRVGRLPALNIRLDDAFGQDLFDKMKSNAFQVSSSENFVDYLKGFAIVADDANTALVAYNDTVTARVHYSYIGADGFGTTGSKDMVIKDYTLKYNQFDAGRTGTVFESLSFLTPVTQSSSNGLSYLQAGTGVGVKIDFPSLKDFLSQSEQAINKVELEVEVQSQDELFYPLLSGQSAPVLLIAGSDGVPVDYVRVPFTTTIQTAQYISGNSTGRNARYVFNLIEYAKILNDLESEESHLILSMGPTVLSATANSIILATENNKPKIKLNILYTKFK